VAGGGRAGALAGAGGAVIFQPGFSTAAKVTSVAGRGIGLDVVRKEIEH